MLFHSGADDLPDVPTVEVGTPVTTGPVSSSRAERFQQLEEQFRDMQAAVPLGRHRDSRRSEGSQSLPSISAPLPSLPMPTPPVPEPPVASVWEERDEAAFYELRRLVPHLSPGFTCSYNDAVLLIAAVQSGGATASGTHTLADKCQTLETERRQLEQRLTRAQAECEALQDEVAESKHRLKATQEDSKLSLNLLAQRREEMRKQLLLESTRTEKLKVRNRKLELENDALKERLRVHLR